MMKSDPLLEAASDALIRMDARKNEHISTWAENLALSFFDGLDRDSCKEAKPQGWTNHGARAKPKIGTTQALRA